MNHSLSQELRYLAPAWLGCFLLPWPALLFWRSEAGVIAALVLFFVGSASLVAYSFRREAAATADSEPADPRRVWRMRMVGVTAALLAAWAAFSAGHLTLNDRPLPRRL